jgi:hypothetical protein
MIDRKFGGRDVELITLTRNRPLQLDPGPGSSGCGASEVEVATRRTLPGQCRRWDRSPSGPHVDLRPARGPAAFHFGQSLHAAEGVACSRR